MPETIKAVVDSYLCTQCGTCVAVCPVNAIVMRETPAGQLVPSITDEKCALCGLCRKFCSGAEIDLDLPENVDPFKGEVYGAYVGHASDESIRAGGQSGGVASALLLFLLETGQIDTALVSTMPNDGSLRPVPILARTHEEILAAQGSKYCPVAPVAILADISSTDRVAAVGVSCQMHGIKGLIQYNNSLAKTIRYRIGLICDRTLLYSCIDQMALNANLDMHNITGLQYRSKARNGWPGEVSFSLISGETRFFTSSLRTRLKDYFTPPRCRLCFDKMNIFCDISVGDPWGVIGSVDHCSVVICRSKKGNFLLQNAVNKGYVELREVDLEQIYKGQGIESRRESFSAFMTAGRKMGRYVPQYNGLAPSCFVKGDPATFKSCMRKLSFNYRVASASSEKDILTLVNRNLFISHLKALAVRLVKGLLSKIKMSVRLYG